MHKDQECPLCRSTKLTRHTHAVPAPDMEVFELVKVHCLGCGCSAPKDIWNKPRQSGEIPLLNEQAFLDCLPNTPDDEFEQYHMDEGNLRHFLAKYLRTTARESINPISFDCIFRALSSCEIQWGENERKLENIFGGQNIHALAKAVINSIEGGAS